MYKLDRIAFAIKSFGESERNQDYWRKQPASERFKAATWLSFSVFGFDPGIPPRMDKTIFHMRKNG
jgi:hypothetical protein